MKRISMTIDPLGDIHTFNNFVIIGCGVPDDYVVCRECIYDTKFPLQCQYRRDHNLEILLIEETI